MKEKEKKQIKEDEKKGRGKKRRNVVDRKNTREWVREKKKFVKFSQCIQCMSIEHIAASRRAR